MEVMVPYSEANVSQQQALRRMAQLVADSLHKPAVVIAARRITADCEARNDECELEAIYEAVKNGSPAVRGLERGVRYVSDPQTADFYAAPHRLLQMCRKGACAGDCDEAAALVAALAGAVGLGVGLWGWGPGRSGPFVHVYPIVRTPKIAPRRGMGQWVALDTTVPEASVGWEPRGGHWLDAVIVNDT